MISGESRKLLVKFSLFLELTYTMEAIAKMIGIIM